MRGSKEGPWLGGTAGRTGEEGGRRRTDTHEGSTLGCGIQRTAKPPKAHHAAMRPLPIPLRPTPPHHACGHAIRAPAPARPQPAPRRPPSPHPSTHRSPTDARMSLSVAAPWPRPMAMCSTLAPRASANCCRKGSVWSVLEMSTMGMVGSVMAKTASKSTSCSEAGTQEGPRYSRTAACAPATKPRGCRHLRGREGKGRGAGVGVGVGSGAPGARGRRLAWP